MGNARIKLLKHLEQIKRYNDWRKKPHKFVGTVIDINPHLCEFKPAEEKK